MDQITDESFRAYFKRAGDFIITKNKVGLFLEENGEVWATMSHVADNKSVRLDFIPRYKDLNSFMQIADIKSIEDLRKISSGCCWGQYLQGNGYLSAILFYYNQTDVNLKVRDGITEVSSLNLHFYDDNIFFLCLNILEIISLNYGRRKALLN